MPAARFASTAWRSNVLARLWRWLVRLVPALGNFALSNLEASEAGQALSGGSPFTYTVDGGTDTFTLTGGAVVEDQGIVFEPSANLPSGITAGTTYYVINGVGSTFQVSATSGGAPVDVGSGSGSFGGGGLARYPRKDDPATWGPEFAA